MNRLTRQRCPIAEQWREEAREEEAAAASPDAREAETVDFHGGRATALRKAADELERYGVAGRGPTSTPA